MISEKGKALLKRKRCLSSDLSLQDLKGKVTGLALLLFLFFTAGSSSAATTFYTLNEQWEKSSLSGKTKEQALDESFNQSLNRQSLSIVGTPPPPAKRMTLAGIVQTGNTVEIEQNQTLFVKANAAIIKFLATDEGIAVLETVDADTLRIAGTGIGSTFIHIWDPLGRSTFELRVVQPRFTPSKSQIQMAEEFERSRSFKLGYQNSRSAFYTGDKFRDRARTSLDFTQNFSVGGDTPYGELGAHMQTQKSGGKTLLTDTQVSLKDGQIGKFKDFNVALGDSQVKPDLMAFPGARIRGVATEHWTTDKKTTWKGFHGREESSVIGTLTPGVVSKRTLNSYLSGGVVETQPSDTAKYRLGYFQGSGKSRVDELNRRGLGGAAEVALGPRTTMNPEIDFDNEHFAQKYAFTTRFDRLRVRSEARDISKKFFTLVGPPSRQGELGYVLDISADPTDKISFSGTFDIFRDRLIPNPDRPDTWNFHKDMLLTFIPKDNASLVFNYQDFDDTGRVGPNKLKSGGVQYNEKTELFGHRLTYFARYQNRGNRVLNNSTSNYVQNQVIAGIYTQIFWGINFSVQQEWNALEEPNISRYTHPYAFTYTFDYSHQLWNTPFFMDARLRLRDEEATESPNSFMSGEDTTEISGGLYYREFDNMELFLTGSFSNYVPESLNVLAPRVEAQFLTGMRYIFDTNYRWSAIGTFEGYVFKDKNGNSVKEEDESGIEGMPVSAGPGHEAVTDTEGHYVLKSVSGKKAALIIDSAKIPYGYAPTSSTRQEFPIIQGKTQRVDFGLTPRSDITGIVFNDLNGDGRYDAAADVGVRKVKVLLEDGQGARSNGIGVYTFSGVTAGEHTASLVLSTVPDGYLPMDVPKKTFAVYEGIRFEQNFPLRAARVVNGRVFHDANANGYFDEGEMPEAGVTVKIGPLSVTTDQDGWYLFDEVNKGVYELTVDAMTIPAGLKNAMEKTVLNLPADPITIAGKDIPLTGEASGSDPIGYKEETV